MPYTKAMQALQQRYGQPRQLVKGEINTILNAPAVKYGDAGSFEDFALSVALLVCLTAWMEQLKVNSCAALMWIDCLLNSHPHTGTALQSIV